MYHHDFMYVAGQNVCLLPAAVGPCKGYFPKWFYNSTLARCEQFIYGGCEGNPNRFDTRESCENTCVCGKLTSYIIVRIMAIHAYVFC